ncbi:MAG: chromosome segregation protein SMC [Armatimonadota bacterium]|nr:chromosome segregation protein SMC [Armatimonadota bacterium]
MYLKRLEMRGFKSFADHTELEFGEGLTAIVGPNGAGKSNIADAVLWALGEQGTRAIRTQTSQDVIFAGAEERSPLGMAEVRLLLDNTDGVLPVDYTEVEVYRRLYRTGESEYGINNSDCLLREVHELFVDTGVGQAAYSLVGQGEIEAILSVRSEDRRELLEEVAGIGKYRRRRRKAQRQLDATEANIRRIADIIYELSSQRQPLERQAQKARQYRELDGQLRELELRLLAIDYRQRSDRLGKLANDQEVGKADAEGTRSRLNVVENEVEKIAAELHSHERELSSLREQAREAERAAERTDRARAVAEEKLRAARERLEELQQTDRDDASHIEQLQQRHQSLAAEREQVRQRAEAITKEIEGRREELQSLERRRQEAEERVSSHEDERQQHSRRADNLRREAEAMASLQEELRERVQRLQAQQAALHEQAEQARAGMHEVQQRREKLAERVQGARERLGELTQRHEMVTTTLREHRAKRDILAGAATAAETRLSLLEELDRSHEGFEDAVRHILEAAEREELSGVRGVVGDLLEVSAKYELAIEAALGERLQWIVVQTEEQALAGVRYLRERGLGWATFLPLASLSSVAPRTVSAPGDGCLGPATRFVRAPRDVSQILDHLLGDCLIVEDLESAIRHLRHIGYQGRAATLAGEVVERGGAVRGGERAEDAGEIFSRKREMEQVRDELEMLRRALARAYQYEEKFESESDRLAGEMEAAADAAGDARAELSEVERDLVHMRDQAQAAANAAEELDDEIEELRKRVDSTAARQRELAGEAVEAEGEAEQLNERLEEARSEQLPASEIEDRRQGLTQSEVALAELREKQRSLQELMRTTEEDLQRARREAASVEETRAELTARIEALEGELEHTRERLAEERKTAEELREQVTERAGTADTLRSRGEELEASARKLRRLLESQQEQVQRAEVSFTREQAQLESIEERLADVYEVTPEQALEQLGDEEPSRHNMAREVNALKREIRKLGHVNLSAIDECERLTAREEFLRKQREDLEGGREDLLQIIEEIDTAAEQEFMKTFRQVAEAFEDTFTTLFAGGTTELYLTDDENPLESGVEVFGQPPGKRQKHLSLLSGGERAMTALALLFAMLRVKPSPFCVLDEIDAALDATNTDRFVRLLKEFAERSQFIIITHNPRTMEAVDLLHGITMQEAGVSQRISVELRDAQEEGRRQQERARRQRAGAREDTAGVSSGGQ